MCVTSACVGVCLYSLWQAASSCWPGHLSWCYQVAEAVPLLPGPLWYSAYLRTVFTFCWYREKCSRHQNLLRFETLKSTKLSSVKGDVLIFYFLLGCTFFSSSLTFIHSNSEKATLKRTLTHSVSTPAGLHKITLSPGLCTCVCVSAYVCQR